MTGMEHLTPVRGRARIEVLDVLRGLAILGIFFMNVPFMATPVLRTMFDPTSLGWAPADARAWMAVQVVLEGTQRCVLQFLFGAGMMVLTARISDPEGPVAVADLYLRRTLWLLAFGIFDIFGMLWPGDILHVYALAALFLLPFRRLNPKTLVAIGCVFALFQLVMGGISYADRASLLARHQAVEARIAAHAPPLPTDRQTIADWNRWHSHLSMPAPMAAADRLEPKAHAGGFVPYAGFLWQGYLTFIYPQLIAIVVEAFCAMCIGVALWKWGIIQGNRSRGFYGGLTLCCYAVAVPLRYWAAVDAASQELIPRIGWATTEAARLLMGLGHVGLINLLMLTAFGRTVLAPFRAAGRTAFSLYFLESFIGIWVLFSPWGFGPILWGKLGWAALAGVSIGVFLFCLVVANIWVRFFAMGPLEWLWRSLAYRERQPFLLRRGTPELSTPDADAVVPLPA